MAFAISAFYYLPGDATATLKTLLYVAKTNSRLSGRKFCACNIYYPFLNIPYQHIKKCAPKGTHRKNASPSNVATQTLSDTV